MCEQMGYRRKACWNSCRPGCRVGAVTLGERGMLWYGEDGKIRELASLVCRPSASWTLGAGDVFHGAYVWSYLNRPELPWSEHSRLPARRRRTRSSIWATRRGCPAWKMLNAR